MNAISRIKKKLVAISDFAVDSVGCDSTVVFADAGGFLLRVVEFSEQSAILLYIAYEF